MVEVTGYGVSPYSKMYAENRGKAIDLHTDARDRLLAHFSREYCARKEGHYPDYCLREVHEELRQCGTDYPADEIWFSVHYAFDTLAYDWHIYTESDGRVRLTPDELPGRHKVYERHMPVLCQVHRDEIKRGKARFRKKMKAAAKKSLLRRLPPGEWIPYDDIADGVPGEMYALMGLSLEKMLERLTAKGTIECRETQDGMEYQNPVF
jgi:hypothetical protein